MRKPNNAIAKLKITIQIDPDLAKAQNNLAIAYHSIGKYNSAWQHVKTAQQLNYQVNPQFIDVLKKDTRKSNPFKD